MKSLDCELALSESEVSSIVENMIASSYPKEPSLDEIALVLSWANDSSWNHCVLEMVKRGDLGTFVQDGVVRFTPRNDVVARVGKLRSLFSKVGGCLSR